MYRPEAYCIWHASLGYESVSHQYHSGYNPDHYIDVIFKVKQTLSCLLITHGHILSGLLNLKPFVFLLAEPPLFPGIQKENKTEFDDQSKTTTNKTTKISLIEK